MRMWYVIQVMSGHEKAMVERIQRVVPSELMEEVFFPQFITQIKVKGEWVYVEKPLFPGYILCVTDQPHSVERKLRRMDDFARVLSQGDSLVPLAREECELIECLTSKGNRSVPMSEAVKEGDRVTVTSGPLLGHEGLIKNINRRKSTALLEFELCGRHVGARVGLAVLSKEQWSKRRANEAVG